MFRGWRELLRVVRFVANFVRFPAVKEFQRSVNIWQATTKIKVTHFYGSRCISYAIKSTAKSKKCEPTYSFIVYNLQLPLSKYLRRIGNSYLGREAAEEGKPEVA